jgi:membrane fusion protein (multidrug efflux system)
MSARIRQVGNRLSAVIAVVFLFCHESYAQLPVTGIVRAVEQVVIRSELSGIVQRIAVKEGERVTEGQVLIEMDNEHQKINLELSRAGLAKAKAAVEETQVLLANAEKESSRIQIAANALPRKELEDILDQILRLKASLAAQLSEVTRSEHDVRLREQDIKDTRILAPFNATVTEIFINKGESLRPTDTPVLELVDLDQLYAELRLPSSYVRSMQLMQPVRIAIEGDWMGRSGQIEGRVTYINPTIDAASRTFRIKVEIPALSGTVRPGMLVEARVTP